MSESLTEFLLARIAEDEAAAEMPAGVKSNATFARDMYGRLVVQPDRIRAECEAKRRIVEGHSREPAEYVDEPDECGACTDTYPCWTLRALALPHIDHPDCQEDWKP